MCIRDSFNPLEKDTDAQAATIAPGGFQKIFECSGIKSNICLLYTSDAADDLLCVDLGGRRIIKKKNVVST